jgi:hypothetical protein
VLRRLPGPFPLDTHGSLVAWCADRCPAVHVTDIGTGADTAITPGRRFEFEESYEGAFSPDGSLLAAPVRTPGGRWVAHAPGPGRTTLLPFKLKSQVLDMAAS